MIIKKFCAFFTIILFAAVLPVSHISCQQANEMEWKDQRMKLVKSLEKKGINNQAVLQAMRDVPRHLFVPEHQRPAAYEDHPLPIGYGQTISQPYVVAYMCQALKLTGKEKVLEIGTGSGYHAAVLSLLCDSVYTIEIVPQLGRSAEKLLDELGYENIKVKIGDGYRGWTEYAPFDAIMLTAAPPEIPQPLIDQLAVGGRLLAPVGEDWQELVLLEKTDAGITRTNLLPVVFVPMTGEAEWQNK